MKKIHFRLVKNAKEEKQPYKVQVRGMFGWPTSCLSELTEGKHPERKEVTFKDKVEAIQKVKDSTPLKDSAVQFVQWPTVRFL